MGKVEARKLQPQEHERLRRQLWSFLEEANKSFPIPGVLKTLFTESEVIMLARRIEVAMQLLQGKTQRGIAERLHVGLTTVEAVNRWLSDACQEYRTIYPPLYKAWAAQTPRSALPCELFELAKTYPLPTLIMQRMMEGA